MRKRKVIDREDIWADRPETGRSRPTPERKAKGDFQIRDTEDAGVTHAVALGEHILDRLNLDSDRLSAAWDFASLAMRNRIVSQGRSCLNFDPVGHDALPDDPHASRDWQELYLSLGMYPFWAVYRVAVEGREPENLALVKDALTITAKFFGYGRKSR